MLLKERLERSKVAVQGGEDLNIARVQFSDDGKWLYVCCGHHVKVFSYSSQELVHTLMHHTDRVTSVLINPTNKIQLFTSSLDGHLAVWDCTDGALLRVIDFGVPLLAFGIRPCHKNPSVFVVIEKGNQMESEESKQESEVKNWTEVALVGMPSCVLTERQPTVAPSNQITEAQQYLLIGKSYPEFVFSFEGTYVVSCNGRVLLVYDLEAENRYCYTGQYPITSLAAHPNKNCIASGNQHGEIHLWYDFAKRGVTVVKTTFHWHAHAVGDLCFTTDGTYLLSGGEESVLVLWQLETHKKQFRPRLGSPITKLACSPGDKYFTVGLQSNVMQLVSGLDTAVESTIGGLRKSHTQDPCRNGIRTGLVLCPRSMSIALNGTPGFLQFYNPLTDTVAQELNVTNLNYVSRPDDTPLTLTTVDQTAFSPDGTWLATVEGRDDGKTAPELRMKLWQYSTTQQSYTLNTCVDPPHDQPVTSVSFQTQRPHITKTHSLNHSSQGYDDVTNEASNQIPLLVSTSLDGRFKTWVLVDWEGEEEGEKKGGVVPSWACRSVGYYHGLSCLGSAFCEDGSLLALNFKKYVTLWDPVTCELRKTFSDPFNNGEYNCIVFGHRTASQYLMATSSQQLQVWDLLSCSVLWCVKVKVDLLVSDPFSSLTATFVPSGDGSTNLYVFDPSSPTPLAVYNSVCCGSVVGGVFLPPQDSGDGEHGSSVLYFMNKKQVLYSLEEEGKEKKEELVGVQRSSDKEIISASERAFHDIFGNTKQIKRGRTGQHVRQTKTLQSSKSSQTLFNAPPHVLPPMPTLCLPFLTSLLPRREGSRGQPVGEEPDTVDDEELHSQEGQSSEDEGQLEVGVVSHKTTEAMDIDDSIETSTVDACRNVQIKNYDWLVEHFQTL